MRNDQWILCLARFLVTFSQLFLTLGWRRGREETHADNGSRFFLVCVCILCIERLRIGQFLILICQLSCPNLI